MLGYVSEGFYDKSYVGKWIYQVMGLEYDEMQDIVESLAVQFFPETATWGLMYHEIKWGLPVRENLPYEERRKLIYMKRDCKTPMTPYRMERYLENITGLEVHVNDADDPGKFGQKFPDPNIFAVTIIGDSSIELEGIQTALDMIKQSHTMYVIDVLEGRYEIGHYTYTAVVPQTKKTYVVEVL